MSFVYSAMAYEQFQVVDYSAAPLQIHEVILSRERASSANQDILDGMQKTDAKIWLLMLVTLSIVSILLSMIERGLNANRDHSIGRLMNVLFGFMVHQSPARLSLFSVSSRVLFLVYSLMAVCVAVFVSATLQTNLVIDVQRDVIDTFRDLQESGLPTYISGSNNVGAHFRESISPDHQAFWEKNKHRVLTYSAGDLLAYLDKMEEVKSGRAAMMIEDFAAGMIGSFLCGDMIPPKDGKVHVSKNPVLQMVYAWELQKSLPAHNKAFLQSRLRMVFETGFLQKSIEIWTGDEQSCFRTSVESFAMHDPVALFLRGFLKTFWLLGVGLGASAVILAVETISHFVLRKIDTKFQRSTVHLLKCMEWLLSLPFQWSNTAG